MGEFIAAVEAAIIIDASKSLLGSFGLPVLMRMLGARFGLVDGPDVDTARDRLGGFLRTLDARAHQIDLTPGQLEGLFRKPEITGMLYSAFENAMETDDPVKSATLADLVVARLHANDDSVDGPATRIAIERMRDVTASQVRLLSFILLLHVDPLANYYKANNEYDDGEIAVKREEYIEWLEKHARPHMDLLASYPDFSHLRGLGLIDFTESAEDHHGFTPPPLNGLVLLFPDLWNDPRTRDLVGTLQNTADPRSARWGIPMVAACTLPPAGWAIAENALREVSGLDVRE